MDMPGAAQMSTPNSVRLPFLVRLSFFYGKVDSQEVAAGLLGGICFSLFLAVLRDLFYFPFAGGVPHISYATSLKVLLSEEFLKGIDGVPNAPQTD